MQTPTSDANSGYALMMDYDGVDGGMMKLVVDDA